MVVFLFLLNHGDRSYRQKEGMDGYPSTLYTPAGKKLNIPVGGVGDKYFAVLGNLPENYARKCQSD